MFQRAPKAGSMSTLPNRPALTAEWLAHRYDPEHDAVHFLKVGRALRRKVPFLTDEELGKQADPLVVRRQDAAGMASTHRLNFIFHSAYCCSTLLANAYDRAGAAFSLKEPVLLNDLVGWRYRGADPQRLSAVLADGLGLLARPFEPGEICVVKPSNIVNGLARAMIAIRPDARALLLHAPLDQYLRSIANKGLWGRLWVRDLLSKFLKEGLVELGFEPQDYFLQSDLQVAAIGWLAQQKLFAAIATKWPDRVRTLNSDVLLARPLDSLEALDRLFGLRDDVAVRGAIVDTVFSRHSKFGTSFNAAQRAAEQKNAAETHLEEITKVSAWAATVAETFGVPLDLPGRLID